MNTRRVNTAAGVINAALTQNRTAAGIALALESAQLLQSPETAAELARLHAELVVSEQRSERRRIAWRMARQRAVSVGGAADRYAARARQGQEALQDMLFTVIVAQMACRAARMESEELRARLAEELKAPLAWAQLLDLKSLDNFLIALGSATEYEPVDGALSRAEEIIRWFRAALPQGAEAERAQTLHEHVIARDAEIERLKGQIEAARAVHVKYEDSEHCRHDYELWPCPTLAALGGTDGAS